MAWLTDMYLDPNCKPKTHQSSCWRTGLDSVGAQLRVHGLVGLEEYILADAAALDRVAHIRQRAPMPRANLEHRSCTPP